MSAIKFNPKDYNDAELTSMSKKIRSSLTNNSNFPNATPYLEELENKGNEFEAAQMQAKDGSKTAILFREQKRKELEEALKRVRLFVELNGQNNSFILASSGFDLASERRTIGVLEKPENLKITAQVGAVKLKVNRVDNASAYCFEYAPAPLLEETKWDNLLSSSATAIINNLKSGKQYAFRVSAIGSDPTRVYSDVVTSFIL